MDNSQQKLVVVGLVVGVVALAGIATVVNRQFAPLPAGIDENSPRPNATLNQTPLPQIQNDPFARANRNSAPGGLGLAQANPGPNHQNTYPPTTTSPTPTSPWPNNPNPASTNPPQFTPPMPTPQEIAIAENQRQNPDGPPGARRPAVNPPLDPATLPTGPFTISGQLRPDGTLVHAQNPATTTLTLPPPTPDSRDNPAGQNNTQNPPQEPQTDPNRRIVVRAVIEAPDPVAYISIAGKPARPVKPGQLLTDNVKVVSIKSSEVVVKTGGKTVTLPVGKDGVLP